MVKFFSFNLDTKNKMVFVGSCLLKMQFRNCPEFYGRRDSSKLCQFICSQINVLKLICD